ncbi:hypothetical protein [Krasilnikovia cinnamomea]|uniref:hypothetical protein n=1 Tax=Krasilnikovia cinnamomea TaxID=349313 RepID=UPI00102B2AC8|nr:hypothetical protein [Krasilnikovia cinnamomea]
MSQRAEAPVHPNGLLTAARRRLPSPVRPGRCMSRRELADALDLGFFNPRSTPDDARPCQVSGLVADETPTTSVASRDDRLVEVLRRVDRLNREVDPYLIHQLRERVIDVTARYEQFDHAEICPALEAQRMLIIELLDQGNHPGQRQQLFDVAAGTSGLLGYLALGRGAFHLARAYCAEPSSSVILLGRLTGKHGCVAYRASASTTPRTITLRCVSPRTGSRTRIPVRRACDWG